MWSSLFLVVGIKNISTNDFKNRIDLFSYLCAGFVAAQNRASAGEVVRLTLPPKIDPLSYLCAGFVAAQNRVSVGEVGADVEGACLAFAASNEATAYMRGVACLAKVQGYLAHKKQPPPGSYSRPMQRALWWS